MAHPSPTFSARTVSRLREAALLSAFVVVAGVVSIASGQDANWDLLNYHLYNPWAWLTGRYGWDFAPAQLQTFHNPLLDVPFYLMVAADWPPRAIAFALAIPAGVGAYFVYRLAVLVFGSLARPLAAVAIACAVVIGVTGPNARALLGSTMNEWPGAALLAIALFLVARGIVADRLPPATLLAAGLLAGAASGLKLTAATCAVGLAVALFVTRGLRRGAFEAAAFCASTLAGLGITLGPWMAQVHALTGNPLFPYFNSLFTSPLLPADWTLHKAFGPRDAWQWLTLPFDLLRPPAGYVSEERYRDARFPLLAALALAALLMPLAARVLGSHREPGAFAPSPGQRAVLRFGALYLAVSFALWAWLHAIHRYLLALEVLTGIALVALLLVIVPARRCLASIVVLTALVVSTTRAPHWGRVPFGETFVGLRAPALPPATLVLLVGDAPMSYVLPSLPADARYVGIATNFMPLHEDFGLHREARRIIHAHAGAIVALSLRGMDQDRALGTFGLVRTGACQEIRSNLSAEPIDVCPVRRMPG